MAGGWRRTALMVLVVTLVVGGAFYVKVLLASRAALAAAEESLAAGRTDDALFLFRRAARAYTPLNPWNEAAMDRLWQLGRKAELAGDTDRALEAYRAIRAAILGARSFYTPHEERLAEVDDRIARLMARLPPAPVDRDLTEAERMRRHAELLAWNPQPDPMWSVLLLVGFLSWLGACAGFILVGLDRDLVVQRRPAVVCVGVFVAGMALWIAGMLLA